MDAILDGYKMLPDRIMRRTDMTIGAKVLYALLRHCARRKDHCWPSQVYLAVTLRQTVRSVQNHLKRLSELGLVAIKKRPWRGNIYYILENQVESVPSAASARVSRPKAPAASAVSTTAPAATAPRPALEKPTKPSSLGAPYDRKKAEVAFERLWSAYPRTEARKPALRSWHRLSRAKTAPALDMLLASIKENLEHNPRWKRGFIPFLVTWLKNRRWEDQLQVEKTSPAVSIPEKQEKAIVLQKEERSAPIQLPEAAGKRLREALSLWPAKLNDMEASLVRAVWSLLYNKNRLPSQNTIAEAVKEAVSFPKWISNFYIQGSSA